MTNGMPDWEEWHGLTQDQRDYSQYKILESMDRRLSNLENRRFKNTLVQLGGSAAGGFLAVVAFFKGLPWGK